MAGWGYFHSYGDKFGVYDNWPDGHSVVVQWTASSKGGRTSGAGTTTARPTGLRSATTRSSKGRRSRGGYAPPQDLDRPAAELLRLARRLRLTPLGDADPTHPFAARGDPVRLTAPRHGPRIPRRPGAGLVVAAGTGSNWAEGAVGVRLPLDPPMPASSLAWLMSMKTDADGVVDAWWFCGRLWAFDYRRGRLEVDVDPPTDGAPLGFLRGANGELQAPFPASPPGSRVTTSTCCWTPVPRSS